MTAIIVTKTVGSVVRKLYSFVGSESLIIYSCLIHLTVHITKS